MPRKKGEKELKKVRKVRLTEGQKLFDRRPDFLDPTGAIRKRVRRRLGAESARARVEREREARRPRDARYRERLRARKLWERENPGIPMPPPPPPPPPPTDQLRLF
ncbi:hypothetical protein GOFOIKOB_0301 [Methylobacterium tardum]|uniref:Uncharacterized protein n=1 Tax=Methylobacterium tardum TaxID=374432 RepID=A0AA37WSM8_9HYPH|nr:hypothetical protein [Methylobacterium tardum]URD36847.1 hypothetical protein M6G65_31855 [Methylobacterium tardum]GJE47280.1 hypothetical protein GOFOIKOB_0301 [Methylobacterium tardum]GLS71349.1 hypothetical protein GCM10007890_33620 [Methylobacterium tardum]